ncbi:MAG: PilN domain-containing protein, partial [Gammaproteobacteria bacterium]|nr:PilN domain-containing protein [Gammaproteobacteria bacterium]
HLKKFDQKNKVLTMTGIAESNARVSDYMRKIDTSEWLTGPHLNVIKTTNSGRRRIANFTLRGNQKVRKPLDEEVDAGGVKK